MARLVRECANRYGPSEIMITSFTRAAAAEIAGRDLPLSPHQIGTLHAHAYRALNHPTIAETKLAEWNEEHPDLALSGGRVNLDEPDTDVPSTGVGDKLFQEYEVLRARMVPRSDWPGLVRGLDAEWRAWKDENYYTDFTDLIERCLRDVECAPDEPSIMFNDEAQDNSPLELALLRKWATHTEILYIASDDDQALYLFRGADGRACLYPEIPEEHQKVLGQSYRLPRTILDYSQQWIKQVQWRKEKQFAPRQENGETVEGEIVEKQIAYDDGEKLAELATRESEGNKSVMILTSCSYMLQGVIAELRKIGTPYHNPWRRTNGSWNPLSAARGVTAAQRILLYLLPQKWLYLDKARMWTAAELTKWIDVLQSKGIMKRGAKAWLAEQMEVNTEWDTADLIAHVFEPHIVDTVLSGDLDWFAEHLLESKEKAYAFPFRVIEKQGVNALRYKPRVVVGTIHSCKGAEADTVILCPDLSYAGQEAMNASRDGMDAVVRMMYVGMTRAREKLILCENAGPTHVDLPSA